MDKMTLVTSGEQQAGIECVAATGHHICSLIHSQPDTTTAVWSEKTKLSIKAKVTIISWKSREIKSN